MKTAWNGVVTAPVTGGLCHSKREQSAFPDIGGRGVEHGKIAGDAAHRQMRRKGHGRMLLGKPIDQLLAVSTTIPRDSFWVTSAPGER